MSICYVLSYRAPDYARTVSLVNALRSLEGIKIFEARNTVKGPLRYIQTLYRLILVRLRHDPGTYILGFRGHEIFPLVRLITLGRRLIFDEMMSPWDSLVNERQSVRKGSLADRAVYLLEKAILHLSDLVLTDTEEHRELFMDLFGLEADRIRALPMGADESLFRPVTDPGKEDRERRFEVFFYGTFLPLHGIDVILDTAERLRHLPVTFRIVGGGERCPAGVRHRLLSGEKANIVHEEWIDYEALPAAIARADLCLGGPFGGTGQAGRVITGKTLQFLAMKKPVVLGRTTHDYGFEDRKNCLLVEQGNAGDLARAVLWAYENRDRLPGIAEKGYALYRERFSTAALRERLREILHG